MLPRQAFSGASLVTSLTSTSTAPIAPGETRLFSADALAPPLGPRDPNDTDESYRRTLGFDVLFGYEIRGTATGRGLLSDPAPVGLRTVLGIQLPNVTAEKSGPTQGTAGLTLPYTIALRNDGNASANLFAFEDRVDDVVVASSATAPSSLAPSQSGSATLSAASPVGRPSGPMTDVVAVTWKDRNGNVYGPTHGSFTTSLQPGHPEGYLTLAGVTGSAQLVGSPQSLTATALDGLGHPAPGVTVHVAITGVNARTLDLTTGVDGTVSFSYNGPNLGHDAVTATATINGPIVHSNAVNVVWASSVGTACTGRTTPLDVILVVD